ncbi:MAG: hypothetical protein DRQ10_04245 [Candidatus Hydrothermota bacterium]|nr:MAG: hypothetical protein DRQ10_04245 [Candidatus Hydrothermae bacterium]
MRNLGFVLIFMVFLFGCASTTKISEIKSNPEVYLNSEVTVEGRVTQTIGAPLSSKGLYQVDDGESSIWVYTEHGVPMRGEKVKVKGIVKSGITLLGKTFAVILVEKERK